MRACLYTQETATQYRGNIHPCGSFQKVNDPQILDGRGLHCWISVCDTRVVHKSHSDLSSLGLAGVDVWMDLCPCHLWTTPEVGKGIRSCIQVLSLSLAADELMKACLGLFFRTSQCASADSYILAKLKLHYTFQVHRKLTSRVKLTPEKSSFYKIQIVFLIWQE